jgi:hypothetical protein
LQVAHDKGDPANEQRVNGEKRRREVRGRRAVSVFRDSPIPDAIPLRQEIAKRAAMLHLP